MDRPLRAGRRLLVGLALDGEKALGVVAGRADGRGLFSLELVAAGAALPQHLFPLFENCPLGEVFDQGAVALLVGLLAVSKRQGQGGAPPPAALQK